MTQPPPGQPGHNQPPYGAAHHGPPHHGAAHQAVPPYGQSPPGQSPYGQPPYGPPYGQPSYGQPPYGQPPYGQSPYGPPRRPKSNGPAIAAALGGVGALAVVVILVATLTGGTDTSERYAHRGVDVPSPTPTTSDTTTETTSSSSETETSTSGSIVTFTEESGGGDAPAGPRKVYKLGQHPLFENTDGGLRANACPLPAWRDTEAAAKTYLTAATDCLNTTWGTLLEAYNLPFERPTLHFPRGTSYNTPCGRQQVDITQAALYCRGNLYMPIAGLQFDRRPNQPGVQLALLAHEYGHHVQQLSGMSQAAWQQIEQAGGLGTAEGAAMSRRMELQAQCFSGMFMGSHTGRSGPNGVTQTMLDNAWNDQRTRGDDTSGTNDHGSNANYAAWWQQGSRDNRLYQCNTWLADAGSVS
ncbi:hypothetical protein LY13_004023 [Prauserella aidingensis]|uniref:neutral zinc metallopeptidase n=1 Tax=Prauserella aidingensis TaxID=387890 RepID=UPI0020A292E2|nr:neutral zinc metallopeptidase [Prauserella aidingensis]MCP2255249.1 hypothetical protein [Prauserella aidingensis]